MASIVVSGQLLRNPSPANVMAGLHYVLGLELLGHDVLYVEERGWLDRCCEPRSAPQSGVPGPALSMVRELLLRMRADVTVVWVDAERGLVEGLLWSQLRERLRKADLMLEIGEPCALEERSFAARRAFVDVDPVVTDLSGFTGHGYDTHFSYGVNPGCRASLPAAPTSAVDWLPTLPPAVPRLWRASHPAPEAPLRARLTSAPPGTVEHGAVWLDSDGGDFAELFELPDRVEAELELALPEGAAPIAADLRAAGWRVRSLDQVESSLAAYHGFLTGARAELGVAREPSVVAQDGWIGDRTACSLAAGRPAIVPDTGIGDWLDGCGLGLLTYADVGQAAEAIELVSREQERHQRAAFRLASDVFHFSGVLTHLLERALPRRVDAVA